MRLCTADTPYTACCTAGGAEAAALKLQAIWGYKEGMQNPMAAAKLTNTHSAYSLTLQGPQQQSALGPCT